MNDTNDIEEMIVETIKSQWILPREFTAKYLKSYKLLCWNRHYFKNKLIKLEDDYWTIARHNVAYIVILHNSPLATNLDSNQVLLSFRESEYGNYVLVTNYTENI